MIRNRKILYFSLCMMLMLAMSGCSKSSQDAQKIAKVDLSGFENEDLLITPYELKQKLDDENVIILDAGSVDTYEKEHIKGAISTGGFLGLSKTDGKPGDEGWGTILDPKDLKERLEALGVDNNKEVVLYSDVLKGPGPDGRNVWQLRMAGLDDVKLLYGGLDYWKALNYPTDDETVKPKPTTGLVLKDYHLSDAATKEYIYNYLGKIKILDVRSKREYEGSTDVGEARGGHIKGAIHFEWTNLLNDDATPKSPKKILAMMKDIGIEPEDDLVLY